MRIDSRRKGVLAKRLKMLSIVAAAFLIFVSIISVYIYYQIEPLVAARIKETIKTSTNGLYEISFSKLTINPFSGNVTLKNLVFKANPQVYNRFKKERINPNHVYEITVDAIKLKRVHPLKVYLKRDLEISSALVEKPVVRVYYERTIEKDSTKVDSRTAWQRLSKYLHSIKVEKVLFKEIDFKYIDKRLGKAEINSVKNLSITIDDILIDSLSHRDQSRFYHTKDVLVEVFDNSFSSNDGMYTIQFDKLEMSTLNKYAMVKGFKVIPRYPEIEFSLKWPFRKARYMVSAQEIWLKDINYRLLTDKRRLHAASLNLMDGSLDVFMNKQLPKFKGDLGENFPQLMLKQLRLTSTIDTVKIVNSKLSYSEYDPYTAKKGKITFIGLGGEILNVTNDSLALIKNHWTKAKLSGFPYGKSRLDFNMNFNLTSPVQEHHYWGKLFMMQARHFNQITRPLALLDISSGVAQWARFSVSANYRRAKGTMTIAYDDLNIGVLKLNKNKKLQRSTLMSLVTNNLLLEKDNPSQGKPLRSGKINFSRPDSISFYSMIWKSLFSGIKENIGMTLEREQSLKAQFQNFKRNTPKVDRKSERRKDREARRKRKAVRQ